ncbi:DAK2 domain-containing protein [Conexibacter sp. SYSU D00693]|uniref:DAK2 domain-containing protein n=1 Tax=Conexibacter sp. SYSU D00693 TaxID=2812560 RepID=UPI00196A2C8B|nr:DAK2 domain-containing protein [Conexibacter sp. SYSU D00693]
MSADPSLVRFRAVVDGALVHLESRRTEINDLNVFPVADGDTGDNMALTLSAVLEELDRLADSGRALDDIGRDEIVDSVARAALLGARGNSGVILSQLIRGAAEELISRPGELVDPVLIGAAMAKAADRAYKSVREPAEGTILTVMREMALAVSHELAHLPPGATRLGSEDDPRQNELIATVLEKAIAAGEASVRRGPELLPALREAGVVDAGGYAVTILFAGVVAALRGTQAPEVERHVAPAKVTHPQHESSTFRFCTNFAVSGRELDPTGWIAKLEALGDSVLVVGDDRTLKVHVHTDEPERATGLFAGVGEVSHLDVADMHAQVVEREERLAAATTNGAAAPTACCGALAVATGEGLQRLFEDLGVHVLDGGPTMNPSTMELLAGIHQVPAEQVVVLTNSPNVRMAAERAAELSEKAVAVVPTRSMQAGLAAAIALHPDRDAAENAAAMERELAHVRTGGVAPAARDDADGRFRTGDAVGYVDDELVAWGDPQKTLADVLARLDDGAELVTCIAGADAPLDDDGVLALAPDAEKVEVEPGGQPAWWWLLSAQ